MFKFLKPPALPQQLIWEYAHEPELMGWTIRARDYNTLPANIMFAFFAVALIFPLHGTYKNLGLASGVFFTPLQWQP